MFTLLKKKLQPILHIDNIDKKKFKCLKRPSLPISFGEMLPSLVMDEVSVILQSSSSWFCGSSYWVSLKINKNLVKVTELRRLGLTNRIGQRYQNPKSDFADQLTSYSNLTIYWLIFITISRYIKNIDYIIENWSSTMTKDNHKHWPILTLISHLWIICNQNCHSKYNTPS